MTQVKIAQGYLMGEQRDSYIAFKGIPYAKPPLGGLRFKAPEPADGWDGVRDATRHGAVCPQYNERAARLEPGSEDCLYLNVYTRCLARRRCAVMVWIHGGAFYTGSGDSDLYGPDFIVENDVVLVTFNYRLEVLGFLCLDNDRVPGNAGLRDQVMALHWVKNNIAAFGGDPENVTIFGCSAGAASVSYHLVSRQSESLFQRAICQSGVCLNDWSYGLYARRRAFQLARQLGCDTDDENELLDFLRSVPVMSLVQIKLPKLTDVLSEPILFGPVIEKAFPNVDPFIGESSLDLLQRGVFSKVPLMLGYTSSEGIETVRYFPKMAEERRKYAGMNVPRELKMKWSEEKIEAVGAAVKTFYFKDKEICNETIQDLVDLETDLHFSYNIVRLASLVSRACPVYLYRWECETRRNFTKTSYGMESLRGVCHSDDIPYIFNVSSLVYTLDPEMRCLISRIVDLWTNFAKTGNPTPPGSGDVVWQPFSETKKNYLIIDKVFQPANNPDNDRLQFWDNIYNHKQSLTFSDINNS